MSELMTGRTPDYIKRNVAKYHKSCRRVMVCVEKELYEVYKGRYGDLPFVTYVKELVDEALKQPFSDGDTFLGQQLTFSSASDDHIKKHCLFSKELEEMIYEKYRECYGEDAPIRENGRRGKGFSFVAYLQWLVAHDLKD